eukprot:PhM_4_TR17738/c0_g2_i1/m.58331/K18670/YAK1; dual specificity protein kinase YAK1
MMAGGGMNDATTTTTTMQLGVPDTFLVEEYTEAHRPRRFLTSPSDPIANDGMDNENFDLILWVGLCMLGRYIVCDSLGSGAFGQVVLCDDLETRKRVAIKVTKNHPAYMRQAQSEVDVLYYLQCVAQDPRSSSIVRCEGSFVYCSHLCIIMEVLGFNLYDLLKANSYVGLSLAAIRHIERQIITSLLMLQDHCIAHCDIKPENILLVRNDDAEVRLIDFGSAVNEYATLYTYIQSRFYRAPEVIIAAPYDGRIDTWSLGCVLAELFLGVPLFPGVNDYHQMLRIVEMVGYPSTATLAAGRETLKYFRRIAPHEVPDTTGFDADFYVGPHDGFQLKTETEFCSQTGAQHTPFRRYFNYRYLGDLVFYYPMPPNLSDEEIQKERVDRLMFLDMLRGMLNPNVDERWRPHHIASHPFLCETTPWVCEGDYHRNVVLPQLRAAPIDVLSPDGKIPQVMLRGGPSSSLQQQQQPQPHHQPSSGVGVVPSPMPGVAPPSPQTLWSGDFVPSPPQNVLPLPPTLS